MASILSEHVPHLLSHELEYEIKIRGTNPRKSCDDRRKQLRVILRREGTKLDSDTISPFPFAEDFEKIQSSLSSLREEIEKLSAVSEPSHFKRISARIVHLSSRIIFSQPEDEVQKADRQKADDELFSLEEEFLEKEDCIKLSLLSLQTSPTVSSDSASKINIQTSVSAASGFSSNYVPVHKWKVSFSGKSDESLTGFLERVLELREARNVSEQELFSSAIDLFSGSALIWFRSIKHTVSNWPSLVELLRNTFLPSDYNDELLAEIRKRTQGENEPVIMFIAHMQGLFVKLNPIPSEEEQIKIIRKNLLPYFLGHLSLQKILTIAELSSLCKQLSETRLQMDKYRPPAKNNTRLPEPMLSYSQVSDSDHTPANSPTASVSPQRNTKCWNCHRTGHTYSECRTTKSRFCYGCGRPDTYKPRCPDCNNPNQKQTPPKNGSGEISRNAISRPVQSRSENLPLDRSTGAVKRSFPPK